MHTHALTHARARTHTHIHTTHEPASNWAVFDGEAVLMVACGFSLASLTSVVTEGGVYTLERGEDGQLGHAATPCGAGRTGSWVSPISSWPQKP